MITLSTDIHRSETRAQRISKKKIVAKQFPVELATVNLDCIDNIAYLIRSSACFGAIRLNILGQIPEDYSELKRLSGSLINHIELVSYATEEEFLSYIRENKIRLISMELNDRAKDFHTYKARRNTCIFIGHERWGVPEVISLNSENYFIPMPGIGFCLNTSQTANIALYETVKQLTMA